MKNRRSSLTAILREQYAQTDTSTDADLDRLAAEALRLGDFSTELQSYPTSVVAPRV